MTDGTAILETTVKSSRWVALGSLSSKVLSVLSFLILARLLDATSYGLIAVALMLVGVFNRMLVTGFETAAIQRKGDVDQYIDSIWTFNLLKSLIAFVIVYLIGPEVADFFHADDARELIRWSGIFVVLPSLAPMRQLYLFRDFKFDKLYLRDLSGQVAYIIVGIMWAVTVYPDVWALFFANLAKYLAPTVTLYLFYPKFPKFIIRWKLLKTLFPYSKWISAQNIADYFLSAVDNLIIGRMMSPAILGYYSKARNLSGEAMSLISNMLKNLSFVAFSKVQDESAKIQRGFLMTIDLIVFFGLTNIFMIWFGGEFIVNVLLGSKWIDIVPALKIFTLYALTNAIVVLSYSLFDGAGKPSINVKTKAMSVILYALLVYIGIRYKSMVGAALGVVISNAFVMLYVLYKLKRIYLLHMWSVVRRFALVLVPFLIATLLFLPWLLRVTVMPIDRAVITLILYYSVFLILFWIVGKRYQKGPVSTLRLIIRILLEKKSVTSEI